MVSNRGYGLPYRIMRKRTVLAASFLMYLDAAKSAAAAWVDRSEFEIAVTPTSMQLTPMGYRASGAGDIGGNLGLDGTDLEEFTIAAVVVRNEHSGNDAVFRGFFNSHYPRLYFSGTNLNAVVQLDGSTITLTVANIGTYIKPGYPHFIVLRGKYSEGVELLIDGTVRDSDATTGTDFDVTAQAFELAKDSNLSYQFNGEIRGVFLLSQKLTDDNLDAMQAMLEYEGYFEPWRDAMRKWSGSTAVDGTAQAAGTSCYQVTRTAAGITATASFEEKTRRDTLKVAITAASASGAVLTALQLGAGASTITGAQAKKLPGVTAGETVTFYGELFAASLAGSRVVRYEVTFYDDTGTQQGSTQNLSADEGGVWEQVTAEITVPASATRVCITARSAVGSGETNDAWFTFPRLVR